MINLKNQTITIYGQTVKIDEWKVYFQTPFGLAESLEEALAIISERDLDADLTIIPVPVAHGTINDNGNPQSIFEVVCRI